MTSARGLQAVERFLQSRWALLSAAVITLLFVFVYWRGANVPGFVHDERSYLVQARLLAQGMLTAPAPPLPEFWEMAHVFVEPRIFSKYPPGHAPVLVPGIWLGLEGLMPLLLAGFTAALVFGLARRLQGPWVALLAWGIWTASPFTWRWHASYFSQVTTTPLWLLALWLLVSWLRTERPWQLAGIVACIAWIGITRPVTGLALMLPIAVVVLVQSWRRRSIAGWGRSAAIGLAICAIIPLWATRTLGSPTRIPYVEYSKQYFPIDLPGFARDTSAAPRVLTPDLEQLGAELKKLYLSYTPADVPRAFAQRLLQAMQHPLGSLALLLPVAVIGLLAVGPAMASFAVGSVLTLVAAYLVMPAPEIWSLYALETFAVMPFLVAAGLVLVVARARSRGGAAEQILRPAVLSAVAVLVLLFTQAALWRDLASSRGDRVTRAQLVRYMLRELPDPHAVIFVHHDPSLSPHVTVWDILGPPDRTPTWIVRSRGADRDQLLIAEAAGRTPYLLDEAAMVLYRIGAGGLELTPTWRASAAP